jgi:hypothetical protein
MPICDKCNKEFFKLEKRDNNVVILHIPYHFLSERTEKLDVLNEDYLRELIENIKIYPLYAGGLNSNGEFEFGIVLPKEINPSGISLMRADTNTIEVVKEDE